MNQSTSDSELPPGRELDALVWQILNGREPNIVVCRYVDGDWQPHGGYPLGHVSPPHYSTDIAAVQEVKQKMAEMGWDWFCLIERPGQATVTISALNNPALPDVQGVAETAPHAICLVALRAVGTEPKEVRP